MIAKSTTLRHHKAARKQAPSAADKCISTCGCEHFVRGTKGYCKVCGHRKIDHRGE